jgi:S-adenosylmethionine hydrolase
MNFKATMGICRKIDSEEKMVIVPQETGSLEENQLVVVISSEEFIKIAENFKDSFDLMETVKKEIKAEK